jgi:uncharacterized protein (TIGR03085 family)
MWAGALPGGIPIGVTYARAMRCFAQRERQALASLLASLGPGAPTLCEGWQSADLAAHLVLRDHRPDAAPGMVTRRPPFGPYTERLQRRLRDSTPWEVLLERLRNGPPALLRPMDAQVNSVEFFVHHEDLRRAQPGWQRRELGPEDEDVLWARARALARFTHRRPARLEAPGRPPLVLKPGGPTLRGQPSELVLWLAGRQRVALVEVS